MKTKVDDLGVCGIIVEDWDITKEFKPKTITTDYSTWIGYISRRPVPANTPITDTYYWKPIFRLEQQVSVDYNAFKKTIETLVYSFIHTSESGVAFTNEFGDNEDIGINQKALTEAINNIWAKIDEITGKDQDAIEMTVTPEYYIGEDGCTVNYSATSTGLSGIFEHIEFLVNGVKIDEANNVEELSGSTHINGTSVITCNAKIMGKVKIVEKTITNYSSFYLGAGTQYSDIMNVEHVINFDGSVSGRYDVTCAQGDHIYIVMDSGFRSSFSRADMNGFEIPFNETTETVDDKEYVVLESINAYAAGTYEININA